MSVYSLKMIYVLYDIGTNIDWPTDLHNTGSAVSTYTLHRNTDAVDGDGAVPSLPVDISFLIMVYAWDEHEETCRRLYIEQGRSLGEIMQYMRDVHDFTPRYVSLHSGLQRPHAAEHGTDSLVLANALIKGSSRSGSSRPSRTRRTRMRS